MSFTAAEPLIVGRVREAVPALRDVLTAAEIEDIADSRQAVPAAHVLYSGYEVLKHNPSAARIRTTWAVVIVTRNRGAKSDGAPARDKADPILDDVAGALIGWKPDTNHSSLTLVSGAEPFYLGAYGYFPLAFQTETTIHSAE